MTILTDDRAPATMSLVDAPGPNGTAAALDIVGVAKSFGRTVVLDHVDLRVERGEIAAVLGPSGGGKTTLLRIIAGFELPDRGSVLIDGNTVVSSHAFVPPERRRVGVVPQEGALFPHLDVAGNVGFGLPHGSARHVRIAEVLDLVGLPGSERRHPSELSGGQQHRVALARALAPRPTLVVLDEPFSALDASLRSQVREEVFAALRTAGTTAILVTHDQQEALSCADRVAVLLDGVIAQVGDPATLYERPARLDVATFVGEADVVWARAYGGLATSVIGPIPLVDHALEGDVRVVLRPEHIEIAESDDLTPARSVPCAVGTIVGRSFFGHDGIVRIRVDHPAGGDVAELPTPTLSVTARVHATRLPRLGAVVTLRVVRPAAAFPATG